MAAKTDFTAEEWKTLLEGVMMAGIAVTAAEPSGLWGMLKEGFASASQLVAGKTGSNELVKALASDLGTSEGRSIAKDGLKAKFSGSKPGEIKSKSIEGLRQAAAIIDAKAPQEATATKAWLRQIAHDVAEASKEEGFLGFGGVKVSDTEKATLAEIEAALKA